MARAGREKSVEDGGPFLPTLFPSHLEPHLLVLSANRPTIIWLSGGNGPAWRLQLVTHDVAMGVDLASWQGQCVGRPYSDWRSSWTWPWENPLIPFTPPPGWGGPPLSWSPWAEG
jgi:hypothetical protein